MSKRSQRSELRLNRPSSPASPKSSSVEGGPEFSLDSSSLISSYSPNMTIEGSSVISREAEEIEQHASASQIKAMALVGCPRCFMYIMLSEVDPKCPKCKSTVFLEFFKEEDFKTDN